MRVSVRLPPPPLKTAASAFARVIHRNLPRNVDVINVAWTPPPTPVCHALVMPRVPSPVPPEHDNALIAWALRLRRLHVVCALAFASAVEEFGEPLLFEDQKLEGAGLSVISVHRHGPLGRIHLLESTDDDHAATLARHIEAGRVPAPVQPLIGPLPVSTLCTTLFSAKGTGAFSQRWACARLIVPCSQSTCTWRQPRLASVRLCKRICRCQSL